MRALAQDRRIWVLAVVTLLLGILDLGVAVRAVRATNTNDLWTAEYNRYPSSCSTYAVVGQGTLTLDAGVTVSSVEVFISRDSGSTYSSYGSASYSGGSYTFVKVAAPPNPTYYCYTVAHTSGGDITSNTQGPLLQNGTACQ